MNGKKVAFLAVMVALAMVFAYVDAMIPVNFGIPGMKLGLANLVIVTGLYLLRPREVFLINVVRIFLAGFLFGSGMSILYSLAGGVLSFFVMLFISRIKGFSVIGVSIGGGVSHNIGQIAAATVVLENVMVAYYLPVLLIVGAITGLLIGIISKYVIPAAKKAAGGVRG